MSSVLSSSYRSPFQSCLREYFTQPQGEVGENSSDTGRANSPAGKAHGGTAFSAQPRPDDSALQRCAWLS